MMMSRRQRKQQRRIRKMGITIHRIQTAGRVQCVHYNMTAAAKTKTNSNNNKQQWQKVLT
jgi:hypothetical protein